MHVLVKRQYTQMTKEKEFLVINFLWLYIEEHARTQLSYIVD